MQRKLQTEISNIQKSIETLKEIYPDQPGVNLIMDGVLVNSLGKLYAMESLNVTLGINDGVHNGIGPDNNPVRITTTQGNYVMLEDGVDTLIVLQLQPDGIFRVVYHGSGEWAWNRVNAVRDNKKRVSLTALENAGTNT